MRTIVCPHCISGVAPNGGLCGHCRGTAQLAVDDSGQELGGVGDLNPVAKAKLPPFPISEEMQAIRSKLKQQEEDR